MMVGTDPEDVLNHVRAAVCAAEQPDTMRLGVQPVGQLDRLAAGLAAVLVDKLPLARNPHDAQDPADAGQRAGRPLVLQMQRR
jgi:hypothetical protein